MRRATKMAAPCGKSGKLYRVMSRPIEYQLRKCLKQSAIEPSVSEGEEGTSERTYSPQFAFNLACLLQETGHVWSDDEQTVLVLDELTAGQITDQLRAVAPAVGFAYRDHGMDGIWQRNHPHNHHGTIGDDEE